MTKREPTKKDFVETWGTAGYRENFEVYGRSDNGGATEEEVVAGFPDPVDLMPELRDTMLGVVK